MEGPVCECCVHQVTQLYTQLQQIQSECDNYRQAVEHNRSVIDKILLSLFLLCLLLAGVVVRICCRSQPRFFRELRACAFNILQKADKVASFSFHSLPHRGKDQLIAQIERHSSASAEVEISFEQPPGKQEAEKFLQDLRNKLRGTSVEVVRLIEKTGLY